MGLAGVGKARQDGTGSVRLGAERSAKAWQECKGRAWLGQDSRLADRKGRNGPAWKRKQGNAWDGNVGAWNGRFGQDRTGTACIGRDG